MKKALKVTFGAVIAVGMVAPIQAHEEYFLNNTAVWVAGTYTKTSNNGMSGNQLVLSPSNDNFPSYNSADDVRPLFLEPDFEWNYALGARFHIPHSHTHVFVSFDHFRNDDNRTDANVTNMGIPSYSPTDNTSGTASVLQKAEEFRFGVDRAIHFGHHFCVDLSAFFEYDRVVRDSFVTITDFTSNERGTRDTENKLRGYGPGVGALGRVYPFSHARNWSLFAGIMNTLLFAKEDFSDQFVFNDSNNTYGVSYLPEQSESVVGKMDINFGVEYSCREHNKFFWDVALGMRFMNMYNAFKNGNAMYQENASGYYSNFAGGSAEDWGRWGPYIQFSVGGPRA